MAGEKHDKRKSRKREYKIVDRDLTFLDPVPVIISIISSDILKDMHIGPAFFVDDPTEFFHSRCWSSSVRASGGIYPHLPGVLDEQGQQGTDPVVFSSDFVYYKCQNKHCTCQQATAQVNFEALHIGRIHGFGYGHRSTPCAINNKEIVFQVQHAFLNDSLHVPFDLSDMVPAGPGWPDDELILTKTITYISESRLIGKVDGGVYSDHVYGECQDAPCPAGSFAQKVKAISAAIQKARDRHAAKGGTGDPKDVPKKPKSWPKYNPAITNSEQRGQKPLFARRMLCGSGSSTVALVPLCHTHPLRAELEMAEYGRETFVWHWDQAQPDTTNTIVLAATIFVDGVGIFGNMYRSIMGVYLTIISLPEKYRCRVANMFPLIPGPHDSDFEDVVKAMYSIRYLDEGIFAEVNGEQVRVYLYTICYTSDYPKMNENAGFQGHKAQKFYRFCFIGRSEGEASTDILDINTVEHGRLHFATAQQQEMLRNLPTAAAQKEYSSQWGFATPDPPLAKITCPRQTAGLSRRRCPLRVQVYHQPRPLPTP